MYIDEIRDYAFSLDSAIEECFPFGEDTFVYKISGKGWGEGKEKGQKVKE